MRETISEEMREANARGFSGALPQHFSLPPSVFPDCVDQFRDIMARERRETNVMLGNQFEAFTDLAESRNRNLRDEMKLIKNEMNFGQEDSSPSSSPRAQRCPSPLRYPEQLASAHLASHERELPAQGVF